MNEFSFGQAVVLVNSGERAVVAEEADERGFVLVCRIGTEVYEWLPCTYVAPMSGEGQA